MSREIKLVWAEAFMFCRSFGMELASLPTESYLTNSDSYVLKMLPILINGLTLVEHTLGLVSIDGIGSALENLLVIIYQCQPVNQTMLEAIKTV